jgi:hypothetical protein
MRINKIKLVVKFYPSSHNVLNFKFGVLFFVNGRFRVVKASGKSEASVRQFKACGFPVFEKLCRGFFGHRKKSGKGCCPLPWLDCYFGQLALEPAEYNKPRLFKSLATFLSNSQRVWFLIPRRSSTRIRITFSSEILEGKTR